MDLRRALVAIGLIVVLAVWPLLGSARQDATPDAPGASPAASPAAGEPLDLAAMALEAADLPPEYQLFGEAYFSPEQFSIVYTGGVVSPDVLEAAGIVRFYESTYLTADGLHQIRSYASEYRTVDGVQGGFDVLENEDLFLPPETLPPDAEVEDLPGPAVGEEPKETSVVTFPGFANGVDATFRVDRVLVGVAVETFDGSEPDADLAEALTTVLFDRVETVLGGGAPAGVDLTLPPALLPLDSVGTATQAGYLRASDVLAAAGPAGIGYLHAVGLGFPSTPDAPILFVSAGVLTPDVADATAVLTEVDASTSFSLLPDPGDSPRLPMPAPVLPEADAVVASRTALLPGGFVDSARVSFVVGERIGVVEVAGAATAGQAEATVAELAAQQAACLAAGETCASAPSAGDLQESALRPAVAAVASPVAAEDAERLALFDEVWRTVRDFYVYRTGTENGFYVGLDGIDWAAIRAEYEPRALAAPDDEAFYAVIAEMIAQLGDQHSAFLSPEEAAVDQAFSEGRAVYSGIGVVTSGFLDPARDDVVLYVFPGSPAEAAGIRRRDRIVAVDGQPFLAELVSELQGPAEPPAVEASPAATPAAPPSVRLTVVSPGEAPRELTVEVGGGPARFSPLVKRLEAAPDIGYVWIPELSTPDMGLQIEEALTGMLAEGPLAGLILDLRSNPGGFPDQALNQFAAGEVGRFYNRSGTRGFPMVVAAGGLFEELAEVPLVVMVDNRSHSASEIVASVLQAQGRALVVGVRSPGNVEAVPFFDFADGSRLYLASFLFRLPGQDIEVTGVVPDIAVAVEWTAYAEEDDPQLLAAIEAIQSGAAPAGAAPPEVPPPAATPAA